MAVRTLFKNRSKIRIIIFALLHGILSMLLSIYGPIGKHGFGYMGLYWAGFISLYGLVASVDPDCSDRKQFVLILLFCTCLHILFIPFPAGNDINRYVWEGYIQSFGFNPYRYAPADPVLSRLIAGPVAGLHTGINHKALTACYPPLTMIVFYGLCRIAPKVLLFKILIIVLSLATLFPLKKILDHFRLPQSRLLLYGANPLVLVFIAGQGHLDSMMVFCLILGMAKILEQKNHVGFFWIGCAVMFKYLAGLALLLLLTRKNLKSLVFFVIPFGLYLFYLDAGTGIFYSLGIFGSQMHFNDFLSAGIRVIFPNYSLWGLGIVFFTGLIAICLTVPDQIQRVFYGLGWMLLCLPTLHAWYLVLILPFGALFFSNAWIALTALVGFTFPVFAHEYATGIFKEIDWLKWVEYLPFYLLLLKDFNVSGLYTQPFLNKIEALSIIIPTINEADGLAQCIQQIPKGKNVSQIIVADGGSTDPTLSVADDLDVMVVNSAKGRGTQIASAMIHVTGEAVLILHADCHLSPQAINRIIDLLNQNQNLSGGAFAMCFAPSDFKKRIVAFLNNARTVLTGIAFGDQGQFFRMEALNCTQGFPDQMLMEDIELSLRLKQVGQVKCMREKIYVSGRRWDRGSYAGNFTTVLYLFFKYLLERCFEVRKSSGKNRDRRYYERYYRS